MDIRRWRKRRSSCNTRIICRWRRRRSCYTHIKLYFMFFSFILHHHDSKMVWRITLLSYTLVRFVSSVLLETHYWSYCVGILFVTSGSWPSMTLRGVGEPWLHHPRMKYYGNIETSRNSLSDNDDKKNLYVTKQGYNLYIL